MTELNTKTAEEADASIKSLEDRQWTELAQLLSDAIDGYVKRYPETGVNAFVVQAAIGNVATASFFHLPRQFRQVAMDSFCDILRESVEEMNKVQ